MTECYCCSKLAELRAENNALHEIVGNIETSTDDDKKAHSTNAPKLSELFGILSDESDTSEKPWHERVDDYIATFDDSREKLEADVREYYRIGLPGIQETELHCLYYKQVLEWLDRQAAITSLEWCHSNEQLEIENMALKVKLDEAKSENEASYERINELYKEVDKAKADTLKAEECEMIQHTWMPIWTCSKCGETNGGVFGKERHEPPNYCPHCGKRVKGDSND